MSDARPLSDIAHGVPPVAVTTTSTLVNRTGSWKYIRPVYQDQVAPCNQGCPVGIDIEGYMSRVREGCLDEACDVLLRENPIPAVTGRVCYHPCESACNRAHFDESVSIHAVERMLGDLALRTRRKPSVERTRPETVAVVGSGPAGLACAYHLARLGYGVVVYESDPEPGGILRYGIPDYRLPKRVLAGEIDRVRAMGVQFHCGTRVGLDVPFEALDRYEAVFVATGVHRSRPLGIEGERTAGVRAGLDFLREVNRGGRPSLGRRVVVVGGGNTAMDCARTAVRLGADVLVLYRRGRAEMPANHEEVEEALREGVRFEFLAAPSAVRAREGTAEENPLEAIEGMFGESDGPRRPSLVEGLECVRMRLEEPDGSGRRRPVPVEGSGFFVPADTVLTALGEEPDFDYLPGDVRRSGTVVRINALGGTSRATVFAGGDITDEPHTVAYALGSGKRAAIGIDRLLRIRAGESGDGTDIAELRLGPEGNLSITRWLEDDPIRRANPVNRAVAPEDLNTAHFAPAERARERPLPGDQSRRSFAEVNPGLAYEEALAEALRCFNCGVCNGCELCLIFCPDVAISRRPDGGFEIDYEHCKGCGLCAEECPRAAITMTREGL